MNNQTQTTPTPITALPLFAALPKRRKAKPNARAAKNKPTSAAKSAKRRTAD